LGGGHGHILSGALGAGAHAANSRIRAKETRRMWMLYLEVILALGVAALIVWFTWPRKK
jgi:drug/metabolite transporter (DMT)-like permease